MVNSLKSLRLQNFLKEGKWPSDTQPHLKLDDKYFKLGLLFVCECIFGDGLAKIYAINWNGFKNDKNFNGKDDKVISLKFEFGENVLIPSITYIMNIMLIKQDEYVINEQVFYPQKKEFGTAPSINLSHVLLDTKKGAQTISTFVNGRYEYHSKEDSLLKLNTSESVFRQNLNPNLFAHLLPIKRSIEELGKMLK